MMSSTLRRAATGLALLFVAAACSGDDGPSGGGGVGQVVGKVVAADGTTPIPGAVVQLAARPANGPSDTTDANGNYTLDGVPSGNQQLVATRGAFEAQFTVQVRANATVTAAPAEVLPTGKLAYVPGAFDAIEDIVRDSLEYQITELTVEQLGTASVTNQYKMIFLNCGADVWELLDDATKRQNLKTWVQNGGVLYASDLTLELVEAMFPNDIQSKLTGDIQDVTATVVSNSLRSFVGKNSVALRYDLPGWETPDALSAVPQVLLRGSFVDGDVTHADKPLAVVIPHGSGKVIFTSFHNEAGVTADQLAVLRYFIYID